MKKIISIVLLSLFVAGTPYDIANAERPIELTVSAAISLKNAFEEIGKLYESQHAKTKVLFNFGASGDLARQIDGGAPVDVFASAAQKDMDDVASEGYILQASRVNFVKNTVVLVTLKQSAVKSFMDLASDKVKRIAAGNPKTVPAGRYAAEVFDYFKLMPAINNKLIYAENVRQVLDYVARGEVDAGVVYATDAAVRTTETKVAANAPEGSHKPVVYPIAVVKGTQNGAAAQAFIDLVRSKEGSAILKKYGFRIP